MLCFIFPALIYFMLFIDQLYLHLTQEFMGWFVAVVSVVVRSIDFDFKIIDKRFNSCVFLIS